MFAGILSILADILSGEVEPVDEEGWREIYGRVKVRSFLLDVGQEKAHTAVRSVWEG
jgi:hypothetical protein